jgi:hypothetical protein
MDQLAMRRAAMAVMVVAGLGAMIPRAGAYSQYGTSSGAGNCATCHGDFRASTYTSLKGAAGGTWTSGLHDTHRNTMLSGDCTACHSSGPRFPVLTGSSASAAPFNSSCLGCHGRVEGAAGLTGRGLRAHHEKHGVTCFICHGETVSSPVVAESVKPPLYIVDANHPNLPQDPCNPSPGFPESFAGTTLGLDNDGNDLYDGADPACVATVPVITLDPGTLSFGNVTSGTTSGALTSAVRNTGTATLTVTAIARCTSPATSAEFAFTSPSLPFDVAPGSSANLSVTYAPTAAGTDTGCIAVTSNASNGPTTNLAVSGTGVAAPAPQIAVAPTTLAFGDVTVGATSGALTFTVSNTGTATLTGTIARGGGTSTEFAFSPSAFSIPASGAPVTVSVTYAPAAVGADSGTLVVSSNDAASPTVSVSLSGNGVAAPAPSIALVPASLDFGTVTVGGSTSLTTSVQNGGTAALVVSSIALGPSTNALFTWSPAAPFTVPAGGNTTVTVTFSPTAAQAEMGTMVFTSNAATSPTSLAVSGTGQAPAAPMIAVSPVSLAFGTVAVGTPSSQTFTISNQGTAALTGTIARAAGTSAEFTFSPATFDVAAGGSLDVTATYTPAGAGGDAGSLVVSSNDASNPTVSVAVSGAGVAIPTPAIALEPTSLTFGAVLIGGSSSLVAQVRNVGTAALTVTSIALCGGTSGEYTWSGSSVPFAVAPGGSADLTVTYAPADAGTDSGCLAVSSDDPASPVVNLGVSGTGATVVAAAIAVTPAALGFGTVSIGSSATRTTQVRNDGNAVLNVSLIARCAGTTAEFAFSPATLTVAAGQSATLSVSYTPTEAASDAGCIALTHDAPGQASPLEVAVTGAGATAPSGGCGCDGGSGTLGLAVLALLAAVWRRPRRGSGLDR